MNGMRGRWLVLVAAGSIALGRGPATSFAAAGDPEVGEGAADDAAVGESAEGNSEALAHRGAFAACAADHEPCVRPHPARVALLGAGFGTLALGAFMTYIVGDRAHAGDPNFLLVGGGLATLAGAAVGQLFSISGHEGAVDGAVEPPTLAVGMVPAGRAAEGETVPPVPLVLLAPAMRLDERGSTLRLETTFGVQAGPEQRVASFEGGEQTLERHQMRFDVGPELSVALPYPLTDRPSAPRTGGVELRYAPQVRVRRYASDNLDGSRDVTERLTLLPLCFGIRWHLSPRQRFELLVGPRWDIQGLTRDGEGLVAPGGAQANNVYGEVWYRIGVPLSKPDRGPLQVTGELSLGYEQWKGDDQALDFGSVVGYLGPLRADWALHLRRPGRPVALHLRAGAIIADGGGAWFEVGLSRAPVAPGGGAM